MAAPQKYPALTGIRAVGATVVFFDHFPLRPELHITFNVLAFFFVLSGFLIVRLYFEQATLGRAWLAQYFVNRFARIYPVYFLLLTLAVWLERVTNPGVLLQNYTLTHALFHGAPLLIQPSWSLTVEECFYALAPLFMLLARRYGFLIPLAAASGLLVLALGVSELGTTFLGTPRFVLSTTFFGHFAEFFAGVYLALAVMKLERRGRLRASGQWRTWSGSLAVAALIGAMILIYRQQPPSPAAILLINNFLIPAPIAWLYWGLIREDSLLGLLLARPVVCLLGRASYSFYLLHTLVIDYVSVPLLPVLGSRVLCVGLTCIVTWLAAIVLFVCYEEPANVFIRRQIGPRVGPVRGAVAGSSAVRAGSAGRAI